MALDGSVSADRGVCLVRSWTVTSPDLPATLHPHPDSNLQTGSHHRHDSSFLRYSDGSSSGYTTPCEPEEVPSVSSSARHVQRINSQTAQDENSVQHDHTHDDILVENEVRTRSSADDVRIPVSEENSVSRQDRAMDFKVSSFTHNQMGSSTPRECRSAGWDGKCDFSNTRSCQSLIRFSEDTKNLTLLYHVYTKCSSAVCKPFGPWCQKLTLKKAKHMSSTFTHSSTSRAGKESSSPTKDRPDRTAPPGVTKYPAKDKNGSPKDTTNIQKDKTAKNSDPSDKTTKSGDVFDRLAGSSSYVFCHSDDVRSHIADYRERHTVGRTGRKSRRVAVLGVDFPDPYAVKRKKPCPVHVVNDYDLTTFDLDIDLNEECVCTEYPTLNSTPTESTTPGGASTQDPCDVNKTPWPGERAARAVPNLAPVRQHNHTSSGDVSSVADKSVVKVRTKSDASPPLLILPSIRKGDDPRSLALTGQTPPRYTTPPDRGAVQGRPSSVNNTDRDDQCVSDVTCDNGKTRPVKLKYTNRCAPHTLQEVTQEDKQTGRGKDVQPVRVVHTRPVADDNAKLTRDCRETRRDDDVRHPGSAPVTDQQTAPPVGHVIVGPTRATHRMITGTATSPDMAKVTASVRDNQDSRVSVTASLNEGLWQLKRDQHKQHVRQGERESRLVSVRVMSVDDLPSLVRTQQFKSPARRTQLFRHQDLPPPPLNMAVYGDRTLEGGEGKENQQLVSLWNTGVAATQLGGVVSLYPQSGDGAVGTDDVTSTTNKAERLRYMYRGNGGDDDVDDGELWEGSVTSQLSHASSTPGTGVTGGGMMGVRGRTVSDLSAMQMVTGSRDTQVATNNSEMTVLAERGLGHPKLPPPISTICVKDGVRPHVSRKHVKVRRSPRNHHQQQHGVVTCCTRKAAAIKLTTKHTHTDQDASVEPLVIHGGSCDKKHVSRTVGRIQSRQRYTEDVDGGADDVAPVSVKYRLSRADGMESRDKRDHVATVSY